MESTTPVVPTASAEVEQSVGLGQPAKEKKPFKKAFNKKNNKEGGEKKEGGAKSEADKAAAEAKKKAAANPNEPYIFIIKNAENDLCRIHESALPQFLGMNVKNQEKRRDGASYYEVKIRSETRTGELVFHGNDEAAFFRPAAPAKDAKAQVNINKKAGEKRGREDAEQEPSVDPATEGEATAGDEGARYSTIPDMLSSVTNKMYYNSLLHFNHTTGQEASTSLMGRLAGAVAEVNQKMNPKALRKVLRDVPGFLSCWFLKATGPSTSQFRVIFQTEADLLSAKEMLDQFEAEQGVRVSLKLSDNLTAKFQKFLVEKAGAGESTDVVTLSTHNADYE